MTVDDGILYAVEGIVRRHCPGCTITPDLPLGAAGLGFDSITLVEVLMDCEERFGAVLAADLLAGEPLTVRGLVEHVQRSVVR